jgi:hypothetical protein
LQALAASEPFIECHETDDGGEGHLEAGIEYGFRRDNENGQGSQGHVAMVIAGRSSITATRKMLIMIQARTVGTDAPESAK